MSSQDLNDEFEDTVTATPSTSVTSIATLPPQGTTDNRKKRKLDFPTQQTISENNIAKSKVLKKLHIQLTRTEHHINYLKRCERLRSVPKSLRINLTPQVPVISSALQLKWEEAILGFGITLTTILLEYWENRQRNIKEEIETIFEKSTIGKLNHLQILKDLEISPSSSTETILQDEIQQPEVFWTDKPTRVYGIFN